MPDSTHRKKAQRSWGPLIFANQRLWGDLIFLFHAGGDTGSFIAARRRRKRQSASGSGTKIFRIGRANNTTPAPPPRETRLRWSCLPPPLSRLRQGFLLRSSSYAGHVGGQAELWRTGSSQPSHHSRRLSVAPDFAKATIGTRRAKDGHHSTTPSLHSLPLPLLRLNVTNSSH